MRPATILGTLVFLSAWTSLGAAQPFQVNLLTAPVRVPINIDSSTEIVPDWDRRSQSPTGVGHHGNVDVGRLLLANPSVRSLQINGVDNTTFVMSATPGSYWLSIDQCVENMTEPTSPPGLSCTRQPPEDRDHISIAWADAAQTGLHRRFASTFNGDGGRVMPRPLGLVEDLANFNSLTNPGAMLSFHAGPVVPYVPPPRWGASTVFPNGEGSGFRTASIDLINGNGIGNSAPRVVADYQRVTGILIQPNDAVTFQVEPIEASDSNTVIALWLDPRGSGGTPAPVFANVLCDAPADMGARGLEQQFTAGVRGDGTALFVLDDESCPGTTNWFVTVRTDNALEHVVFHARVSHVRDGDMKRESVGVRFGGSPGAGASGGPAPVTPSHRAIILAGLREAAWRYFGASGGTRMIVGFDVGFRGCPTGTDICITDEPDVGGTCNTVIGNITFRGGRRPWDGMMRSGQVLADMALTLPHEWGHCDLHMNGRDEYFDSASNDGIDSICGDRDRLIQLCTHSIMSSIWGTTMIRNQRSTFCTDATHRSSTELGIQMLDMSGGITWVPAFLSVGGPDAIHECAGGGTDFDHTQSDSMWHQINTFAGPLVAFTGHTPDNHHFRNFALDTQRTELGTSIVVVP